MGRAHSGAYTMHSQGGIGGSSSMDHDSPHLTHHDQAFASDQWGDMSPYISTTVADYGGGAYTFMSPISHGGHGLPSESLGRMAPPATPPQPVLQPQPHAPPPPHHPTLPLLMVPSHPTWPSMLTNPGGFNTSPPVAIPPVSTSMSSVKPTRPPAQPSQPRKTLTDEDRRRMCQCHLDNPTMKQTEIGAMFGVERSTVSKVLSRKEKWLNPEERVVPPSKKSKSKIPDIDKTLANWLRNEQHKGRRVSDAEIQEQARMYARPFREAETKINNPSWLEKFKQKHGAAGRLIRRASETNIPSAASSSKLAATSPVLPSSQPSSAISSGSPAHHQSPSPFSSVRAGGEEDKEGGGAPVMMMDLNQQLPSKGTGDAALKSHHSFDPETAGSSFSESNLSPTGTGGQFTFSPDPNVGGFLSSDQARHFPPGGPDFQRPRSQTFPTLNLEYMNQAEPMPSNEPMTPKFPPGHQGVPSTGPSSAIESPAHEFAAASPFGLDSAVSPHHQPVRPPLHHSSSTSSLQGRLSQQQQGGSSTTPVIGSAPLSSVASSPVSPSQEDARRAADTLLSFIANSGPNGIVDQTDYNAVVRLTDKLRIHQQAQQAAATVRGPTNMSMGPPAVSGLGMGIGMGGLDRIPEGDAEMSNTGQHVEDEGDFIKSEEAMVV